MLNYERTGSGEPLVLIHGLLGSREIWEEVVPLLSSDFDVIAIDLPGHGNSEVEPGVETMADAADAIAEVLDDLDVDEALIVGHSWGGYVTLELLHRRPDLFRGAVLAYSQPYADPPEKQQGRSDAIARFETEPWETVVRDLLPIYFADYDPPEIFERTVEISKAAGVDGARFALTTVRDRVDRTADILAHPEIPLLFIKGTDDRSMPPIDLTADHIAHVITTSSHMGPLSIPVEFCQILGDWNDGL